MPNPKPTALDRVLEAAKRVIGTYGHARHEAVGHLAASLAALEASEPDAWQHDTIGSEGFSKEGPGYPLCDPLCRPRTLYAKSARSRHE
jgi:hypothetical protein